MKSLAIIGGGQLGFHLCEAAERLGVATTVVSPDEDAPALTRADIAIVDRFESEGLAKRLASHADVVTFELEAVPDPLLHALAEEKARGNIVSVYPDTAVLSLLKNKATQKSWLVQNGFPTLPYLIVSQPVNARITALKELPLPFVQKAQSGGYDGYGVQIIRSEADLEKLWNVPSIIEEYLDTPVELAVMVGRGTQGDVCTFPPVRMAFDHERNILDAVICPAGLPGKIEQNARQLAENIVRRIGGVGMFAVEMFLTAKNELLVNEISPRVHNAGHLTLEACPVSQFEQHVRAVCGMPLDTATELKSPAVMQNLLHSEKMLPLTDFAAGPIDSPDSGVFIHWYGKRDPREGRKMGHMTCLDPDAESATQRMRAALLKLQRSSTEAAA